MMLKKLKGKMPSKPEDMGLDMEEMKAMESEEGPEEEMAELPEEEMMEEEVSMEKPMKSKGLDLESLSDDELMAELKKRGLMSKLEGKEEGEDEEDMYV